MNCFSKMALNTKKVLQAGKNSHLKLSVSMKPKRMILNKIDVNPGGLETYHCSFIFISSKKLLPFTVLELLISCFTTTWLRPGIQLFLVPIGTHSLIQNLFQNLKFLAYGA